MSAKQIMGHFMIRESKRLTRRLCTDVISKGLEHTNAVVLDIQNNSNKAFIAQLRNQAPLLFDQSGALINRLAGHEKRIIDLAISPQDNRMATSSEDGLINFWDEDGKLIQTYKMETPGAYANQLVATSTGEILAIFNDHSLKVFSKDGVEKHSIQEANKITSAIPSADGKLLLTCTAKGLVKLWDANSMTLIKELANTGNYIHQAVFSLDGSKIILAPEGQGILVLDRGGAPLSTFAAMRNQTGYFEIACAPDQSTIALAAKNGRVEVWNLEGEFLSSFQRSVDQRQLLSFSADGKKLLSIDKKNSLVLWDLNKGAAVYFDQHKDQISSLSFSPDGQYILSGSKDHTAKLWKMDGSLIMNLDRHTAAVRVALFSKDGSHIITGGADQQIFVSPTFNHVLAELNEEIETELTTVQKQKWGLN